MTGGVIVFSVLRCLQLYHVLWHNNTCHARIAPHSPRAHARCFLQALPWYTSVREKINDPS